MRHLEPQDRPNPGRRSTSRWIAALGALLTLGLATQAPGQPAAASAVGESPEVRAHVARAQALAGDDLKTPLFLCRPDSGLVVRQALESGSGQWQPPTRLFDNLFYIGDAFVGVLVVKTSAGLILFDSTTSADNARDHLVPALISLGLDPRTIRYVTVTHGHWDHFGGAAWLRDTYGARVGLSRADWDMIGSTPASAPGMGGHPPPARDLVIEDGQTLTLGDTTIRLYLTPGHTPGTVSAILPARENGKTYTLSLLGSVAFPPSLEPTPTTGGLLAYERSVRRFAEISRAAGAQALFNTHVFADGGLERMKLVRDRGPGGPNPFLLGSEAIGRYYGLVDECLLAAIARPHSAADDGKPTVPSH
jgi:metallo-beta-lactamase class B